MLHLFARSKFPAKFLLIPRQIKKRDLLVSFSWRGLQNTMLNNSETDRNKSAQYKVKSRHFKWLLLIAENLFKKSYQFLKSHVRIFVKDATPLLSCSVQPCSVNSAGGTFLSLKVNLQYLTFFLLENFPHSFMILLQEPLWLLIALIVWSVMV